MNENENKLMFVLERIAAAVEFWASMHGFVPLKPAAALPSAETADNGEPKEQEASA